MKRKFNKVQFITVSLLMAVVFSLFYCVSYWQRPTETQIAIRNIEVGNNALNCQSIFDSFDDGKLEVSGKLTTFEGVKTFTLADFETLDLVSESTANEDVEMKVKYKYSYNSETNLVTLSAKLVDEDGTEIIDTMTGAAFINEEGQLDVVFNCDGEYILLSELQNADLIQNCGWFSNIFKKVANVVKKVVSNPVGVIGAVATVVAPAVVGVVMAVAAAPVVATIAVGAAVGAGLAAGTAAVSTYIQDGKVDMEAVGICAGLGAAVGAVTSGVAYGITNAITGSSGAAVGNVKADLGNKLDYAFGKASGTAHNVTRSAENAAQLSKIGVYDNATGRQILTEHFNNAFIENQSLINAGTSEISTLLSGPGGFLNVKSIWDGAKLITFWFIG